MGRFVNLPENPNRGVNYNKDKLKQIWLAGGCFWGVEAYVARIYGVADTETGYANGNAANPRYEDVCYRGTGHAEAVYVKYDPEILSLKGLLKHFFSIIDPTVKNRQGNDIGSQYRTGIYYNNKEDLEIIRQVIAEEEKKYDKPIVTEVMPLDGFYPAEDYHQNYLDKNPNGYCHVDFSGLIKNEAYDKIDVYKKPKDDLLHNILTKKQYDVTQLNATEPPFQNEYWDNHEEGIYVDIVTGEPLFSSNYKYDSGSGWPSFTKAIAPKTVKYYEDHTQGMKRIEVRSSCGDSHLGHVFEDGPQDKGGLRFCINSASMRFIKKEDMKKEGYSLDLLI